MHIFAFKLLRLRACYSQLLQFVFPFLQFLLNLIITLLVFGFVCLTLLFLFLGGAPAAAWPRM